MEGKQPADYRQKAADYRQSSHFPYSLAIQSSMIYETNRL
jgi:hypothetical protein